MPVTRAQKKANQAALDSITLTNNQKPICRFGEKCYRKNPHRRQNFIHDTDPICPCGGGQSCIIDRRTVGDWIHEDDVFRTFNIPLRTSCMQPYTSQQDKALKHAMNGFDSVVNIQPQLSLWERWSIDGEIMHDYEAEKKDYDEQMND